MWAVRVPLAIVHWGRSCGIPGNSVKATASAFAVSVAAVYELNDEGVKRARGKNSLLLFRFFSLLDFSLHLLRLIYPVLWRSSLRSTRLDQPSSAFVSLPSVPDWFPLPLTASTNTRQQGGAARAETGLEVRQCGHKCKRRGHCGGVQRVGAQVGERE